MAEPGPTTSANINQVAANLVRLARARTGASQRELATAAGVAQSTVARIESGTMQPTIPVLYRLLAALDLEPRIRLEEYDAHDDVLDRLADRHPGQHARAEHIRDATLAKLADHP